MTKNAMHDIDQRDGKLTPEQIERAADILCETRKQGQLKPGLDALTPATMPDGYALQDAFLRKWNGNRVGWKVGATASKVQEVYGVTEPFSGPFFEADCFASPASPSASSFNHKCIESEFAFRFGADLGPRNQPYSRDEILDAVAAILPAFELISPRFDTLLQDRVALAAADCGLNGGFVLGEETKQWRDIDYPSHVVTLTIAGELAAEGTGANVLGHPFNVLDWLVNHLSARGITLKAGEIVSTGTCTGFIHIETGQEAVADFGTLGQIAVTFT